MTKIVFIDIEASSLSAHSYPIEVAWVLADGTVESHLIRPEPGWDDWDPQAEAVHGISREQLAAEGKLAAPVARRLHDVLVGCHVFSDAPEADTRWLAVLLSTGGLSMIRVRNVHDAYDSAVRPLAARMPAAIVADMARSFLRRAEGAAEAAVVQRHRAASDARRLWETWRQVKILVNEALDGWPG